MNAQISLITALCLTASLAQAQIPRFEVAEFPEPSTPPVWGQETTAQQVALIYEEKPGEHTILMVHTCVDVQVAGPAIARGVATALPFLALPSAAWSPASPELAALSATYKFSGQQLVVPPRRVAAYVQEFVGANYSTDYGTRNLGTTTETRLLAPGMIVAPANDPTDERLPFGTATWSSEQSVPWTFDAGDLGHASVIQTAYDFHSLVPNIPPLSTHALEVLNRFMHEDLGFAMYVQALHVTKPSSTDPKINVRISRHARVTRRSLLEINEPPFTVAVGKDAWVPWPIDPEAFVSFAAHGEVLMFDFGTPVSFPGQLVTLTALMPTLNGYVEVQQIANPLDEHGNPLRSEVGLFPCTDILSPGLAFFFITAGPGAPTDGAAPPMIEPVHNYQGGHLIIPYDLTDPNPPSAL